MVGRSRDCRKMLPFLIGRGKKCSIPWRVRNHNHKLWRWRERKGIENTSCQICWTGTELRVNMSKRKGRRNGQLRRKLLNKGQRSSRKHNSVLIRKLEWKQGKSDSLRYDSREKSIVDNKRPYRRLASRPEGQNDYCQYRVKACVKTQINAILS